VALIADIARPSQRAVAIPRPSAPANSGYCERSVDAPAQKCQGIQGIATVARLPRNFPHLAPVRRGGQRNNTEYSITAGGRHVASSSARYPWRLVTEPIAGVLCRGIATGAARPRNVPQMQASPVAGKAGTVDRCLAMCFNWGRVPDRRPGNVHRLPAFRAAGEVGTVGWRLEMSFT
jgi:hypothetical protein